MSPTAEPLPDQIFNLPESEKKATVQARRKSHQKIFSGILATSIGIIPRISFLSHDYRKFAKLYLLRIGQNSYSV